MCRLTGLVESVEESEGLRRDGAWEHGVLQQRAAGEAALDEAAHVCVLMHVSAAQARTRGRQERPVRPRRSVLLIPKRPSSLSNAEKCNFKPWQTVYVGTSGKWRSKSSRSNRYHTASNLGQGRRDQ